MDESLVAAYPELERHHFWWSVRRSFFLDVCRQIRSEADASRRLRVLDVGCGSGMFAQQLAVEGFEVVAVDTRFLDEHANDDPVTFVEGDYLEVSPDLGLFDIVLALDVVEHFEDEGRVLDALRSNLAPGGRLVVSVPAYQWLWSSHDVENQHFRRYTRGSLRRALQKVGLDAERCGHIFLGLVAPKYVVGLLNRSHLGSRDDGFSPSILNNLARFYFLGETRVARSLSNFLPVGTSVVSVSSSDA